MKVILVARRYYPHIGGVETHVKNLAERFIKKIDVEVYTLDNKDSYEEINGIPIHRFKQKFSYGLERLQMEIPPAEFLHQLQQSNADIIHIHSLHNLLPYYIAKCINSSNIIVTPHYLRKGSHPIYNIVFGIYKKTKLPLAVYKTSKIICVGESERDLLQKEFNIPSDKLVMIPNGMDIELYNLTKNVNKDPRKILFVGRFVKYKGAHKVIEAMKYLKDYRLTVVGDGKEKYNLIKLINRLNLNDRVRLRTNLPREEVVKEYETSSIFIYPSEIEAQPISVVEALIFGLKTIVANASGSKDFVSNTHAYGIDTPITAKKIADAVMNIDTYSFKPYRAYSWDEIAERVLRVYDEV